MTDLASGTTQIVSIAKGREDGDPTAEWLDALDAVVTHVGKERAQYLFDHGCRITRCRSARRVRASRRTRIDDPGVAQQPPYPGNLDIEEAPPPHCAGTRSAMVVRANQRVWRTRRAYCDLCVGGGFCSRSASTISFAAAPGADESTAATSRISSRTRRRVSMRALILEGLSRAKSICSHYRREYRQARACVPYRRHPWLMPDFWQFPTGSDGHWPDRCDLSSALRLRYLAESAGSCKRTDGRKVWGFFGDGEMDEPESIGALPAGRARSGSTISCSSSIA